AVIANGAGLGAIERMNQLPFQYTQITGKGNLNFTQMMDLDRVLSNKKIAHRLLLFDGVHNWAPSEVMKRALSGILINSMLSGSTKKDSAFIRRFITKNDKNISILMNQKKWLKASNLARF